MTYQFLTINFLSKYLINGLNFNIELSKEITYPFHLFDGV
jgi:hypothetical protein